MTGSASNKKGPKLDIQQKEYKKIGKRLTQLRKTAGFKGSLRFALEIGMHPAQYARYEAGTDMKISSLIKILAYHKLTLSGFFAGIE